jgi:hypothetical protein
MSKMLLLSFPKWGQLNFGHVVAMSGDPAYEAYLIKPSNYIKDEYRSAARGQGGTTSGNYVSQAAHPYLIHV